MHAAGRREVELVARSNAHRVVPRIDIANRAVDAEFGRAVRIGQHPLPERLFPRLEAPNLSVAEEQPLIAGQAVKEGWLRPVGREVIGGVGGREGWGGGDIFAEGQAAVHVQSGYGRVT